MFYREASNQYINEGQAFEVEGVQYPANWLNLASPEDKAALGLQEVTSTNSPADARFYWVSETLDGASLTYTNTPKDLAILQDTWLNTIDATAWQILNPTDYMDSRKANDPTFEPPAQWLTWRDAVRAKAKSAKAAIKAATTVEDLIPLTNVDWPLDPNHSSEGQV